MEALKLKTVHVVSDSPMNNQEISAKLSSTLLPIRDISVRLKAFAEEIEINRIQELGNPKRSVELDRLRASVNSARAELERAYWTLGSEILTFRNKAE